jgi:hypothetical protein
MINRFLKAKHWQLFLLTFGVPMVLYIFMMVSVITNIVIEERPEHDVMLRYLAIWPVIMIVSTGTLMGWIWSVVIGLHAHMPPGNAVSITRFKVFFFFPLIYMAIIVTTVSLVLLSWSGDPDFVKPSPVLIGVGVTAFILTHLFSMFCMFHSIYCVAKTVKAAEWRRSVTFSDFIGEFFLVWFFVIGVWILQPKINKIIRGEFTGGGLPQFS